MARTEKIRTAGDLATLVAAAKSETVVVGPVTKHIMAKVEADKSRRQDILHPSEMAKKNWCHRQSFYRISGEKPSNTKAESFSLGMQNVFAEGHEIHNKWQTWIREIGILWGTWKCALCNFTFQGTSPIRCPYCLCNVVVYKEVPLDAEAEYKIAGHADGAMLGDNAILEIKSIGSGTVRFEAPELVREHTVETTTGKNILDFEGLWKSIRKPLPAHLRQVMIYLAIAKLRGIGVDYAVFVYESKMNQQIKEFRVKYSPVIVKPLLDKALAVKTALDVGVAPERPDWASEDHPECKACPFLGTCYAGRK